MTAVEFLVELLNNLNDNFEFAFKEEIEQAKEMEKQQIINAWNNGLSNWDNTDDFNAEQYHYETFNK